MFGLQFGGVRSGMSMNRDYMTGFVVGLGAAAAGYYVYIKNKDKVDDFLRRHGVAIPVSSGDNLSESTLEELVLRKEKIEDIIAEKEMVMQEKGIEVNETVEK